MLKWLKLYLSLIAHFLFFCLAWLSRVCNKKLTDQMNCYNIFFSKLVITVLMVIHIIQQLCTIYICLLKPFENEPQRVLQSTFIVQVINICITLKNLLINIYYQQNRLENKSYDNKNFMIAAFNKQGNLSRSHCSRSVKIHFC